MLQSNKKTGWLITTNQSDPCPSCKAPFSREEAMKKHFWSLDDSGAYRCPHCGVEVATTVSLWPAILAIVVMFTMVLVTPHIEPFVQQLQLSDQAKTVARWIFTLTPRILWVSLLLLSIKESRKPFWKLAKPEPDKNNEGT